jgi:hypothetical protein
MEKELTQVEKDVALAATKELEQSTKDSTQKRIDELVGRAKAAEAKLLEKESKEAAQKLALEEEKAKATGDFEKYKSTLAAEREVEKTVRLKEKDALNNRIRVMYVSNLAIKHGLLKDEYSKLFDSPIDVSDDLEIKNPDVIEAAFIKFKEANPTLFTAVDKKVVKVDQKPVKKLEGNLDNTSGYEKILSALHSK